MGAQSKRAQEGSALTQGGAARGGPAPRGMALREAVRVVRGSAARVTRGGAGDRRGAARVTRGGAGRRERGTARDGAVTGGGAGRRERGTAWRGAGDPRRRGAARARDGGA